MFGNLKKKLTSVIQEASDNIQQYRQRVSTPSVTPTSTTAFDNGWGTSTLSELGIPPNLNMAAGCNLLAKYEDDWKAIHDLNEENAQKADEVAQQIEEIARRSKNQQVAMTDLLSCLAGVPQLVQLLQTSLAALEEINKNTEIVEQEFEKLQDLCEECDLQEYMMQKQFELQKYKQNKMVKLEAFRQKVAADHQLKIQQNEERLLRVQRERQAVFDSEFQEDLEAYKQTGQISKISKAASKDLPLEEVVLEDAETKDALEEFLNS